MLLGVAVTAGAASEPACAFGYVEVEDRTGLMTGYVPTFKNGDELPQEGVFALTLRPRNQMRFFVGSVRILETDEGYGAAVVIARVFAGRYRVRTSRRVDVEFIQNYRRTDVVDVVDGDLVVDVGLVGGPLLVQVRDSSSLDVVISILPVQACRPTTGTGGQL